MNRDYAATARTTAVVLSLIQLAADRIENAETGGASELVTQLRDALDAALAKHDIAQLYASCDEADHARRHRWRAIRLSTGWARTGQLADPTRPGAGTSYAWAARRGKLPSARCCAFRQVNRPGVSGGSRDCRDGGPTASPSSIR